MRIARDIAWDNALKLAQADPTKLNEEIAKLDQEVSDLGQFIFSPSNLANLLIRFIRIGELKKIQKTIQILSN